MVRVTVINVVLYKKAYLSYKKFELIPVCLHVGRTCSLLPFFYSPQCVFGRRFHILQPLSLKAEVTGEGESKLNMRQGRFSLCRNAGFYWTV